MDSDKLPKICEIDINQTNEISVQVDTIALLSYISGIKQKNNRFYRTQDRSQVAFKQKHLPIDSVPYIAQSLATPTIKYPFTEKTTEFKVSVPTKLIQNRTKSSEFYKYSQRKPKNKIRSIEDAEGEETSIKLKMLNKRQNSQKNRPAKFIPYVDPFAHLSSKLLPKEPLVKLKKVKDYRRYNHSPTRKLNVPDLIIIKPKALDLTVSNSRN
jgi:hypothetical protein